MKNKNLFDYLENAEDNDIMKLNEKAPELNNAQIEKLLEMSERKYNIKKNNADFDEENSVKGVEKYSRPWLRTMYAAASVALLLGGAVLGITLLHRSATPVPNDPIPPIIASPTEENTQSTDIVTSVVSATEFTKLGTGTGTVTTVVEGVTQSAVPDNSTAAAAPNAETNAVQQQKTAAPNNSETQTVTTAENGSDEALKAKLISVYEDYLETTNIFSDPSKVDFDDAFYVTDRYMDYSDINDREGHVAERQYKYVHYDDPRFHSLEDIRDYLKAPFVYEQGGSDKFAWYDDLCPGRVIDDTNNMIGTSGGQPYCVYDDKVYVLSFMFESDTTYYRQREQLADKNSVEIVSVGEYEYDPFVGYEFAEIKCNCIVDAYTAGITHNVTGRIQFLNVPGKGWKILQYSYEDPEQNQ